MDTYVCMYCMHVTSDRQYVYDCTIGHSVNLKGSHNLHYTQWMTHAHSDILVHQGEEKMICVVIT